jgi:hypothetical protein
MGTTSRTTAFGLPADVKGLVESLWDGRKEEPVFEHIGLPRERTNLGPGPWFLAGAVAVAMKALLMMPESGWVRRRIARLVVGEQATRPIAVDDEPFETEAAAPKPRRDLQGIRRTRSDRHHISA